VRRLTGDQLEALFCAHWARTRDLRACLRLVIDAEKRGEAAALAAAAAWVRHQARPGVADKLLAQVAVVEQAKPLLERFARASGLQLHALIGRKKTRAISRRRDEAMLVVRKATDMSYPEISLAFGRRHSSVIRGVRRAEARIANDPAMRVRLEAFVKPPGRGRAA
jgi:chromosomal replication initiation ATPase DnaA